jgi:hypothetical protein
MKTNLNSDTTVNARARTALFPCFYRAMPWRPSLPALNSVRAAVLAAALLATSASALATVRYVDVNSTSPASPYTNWLTAATTIQAAVDTATSGDEIVVTNGVYATGGRVVGTNILVNRAAVDKPLKVRSVNGPQFTVIKGYQVPGTTYGASAIRCVYLVNGASLSGFTLTNGATLGWSPPYYDHYGSGVWCESTNAVVTNCVLTGNSGFECGGAYGGTFYNCTLTNNWGGNYGGAYGATLNNCTLTGNSGANGGGANSCTLNNCTLTGNYGYSAYVCTLNNCVLTGNYSYIYVCTLNNCLVTGNSSWGAVFSTLNNCTLTGNSGGGAYQSSLTNCIVYYNASGLRDANYTSDSQLSYCCTTPLPSGGVGNLDAEPALADAFRLSPNSPCLGKGSYASLSGVDIDGEPWANPPAIGCDEYYSGSLTGAVTVLISASYTNVATGFSVGFQAHISGRVSDSRWEFGDGTVVSNRPCTSHAWSAAGDYPVILRAYNNSNPAGVATTFVVHVVTQPVHYVALGNPTPAAPFSSWATAATNIQDAIDVAMMGDKIVVTNGVYATGARAVNGTNRVAVTKPVVVRSVNGPQFTAIRGYQIPGLITGAAAIRCVYLTNGAILSGFTLTNGANGSGFGGGGVWCELAAVVTNCVLVGNSAYLLAGGAYGGTLNNCTLRGNSTSKDSSSAGGGAYSSTLNNCTLINNSSYVQGGGAFVCTLNNCTLTGNSATGQAGHGGGADACTLNNCLLTGNQAADDGGGATWSTLNNCTLSGNSAANHGGGAYCSALNNCTLSGNSAANGGGAGGGTLNNCTLTGNSATLYGGGARMSALYNCTLSGNSAAADGGGASDGTLNNCTVTGNSAGSSCGGVAGYYSPCPLTNCIVYFNTAPTDANYDSTNVLNYCCTTPLPATGVGNITSAPLFVDYSGGNLRLQSNSPGINAGNNVFVASSTDLDARPRIVGGTVDMGAYEFQPGVDSLFLGWLQQYGLPRDGSADFTDPDGDGHNNWQEWRCWTDPTNAASVLKLQSPVLAPPGVLLRWSSVTNRIYVLERSTNLAPPQIFSLLQSNVTGQAGTTSHTDTNAIGHGPFFYRVGVGN